MDAFIFGMIAGLIFGLFSALIMFPMNFDSGKEKWEALTTFVDRFMIRLIVPNLTFGLDPVIRGLLLGIGLSLPSAMITLNYTPIMVIGAIGRLIIGCISKIVLI